MNTRKLGAVMQMAYVVDDLHDAIRQWTSKLCVGPFYVLERVKYLDHEVDGLRSSPQMSLAFAYSGEYQIELVQQHDEEPSVVRSYPASPMNGFHHVGILSDDMPTDEAWLAASGLRHVGSSISEIGVRVAFFHGGAHAGGLVELIRIDDVVTGFFGALKRAAAQWDGVTPYGTPPG
jgi:methylmalonyl-CoA/ethylmalonyl-CoA epimerase